MVSTQPDPGFWRGRRVLVTGHTGFKGSWLVLMLHTLGAQVCGLSLPAMPLSAWRLLGTSSRLAEEHEVDLRDGAAVFAAVRACRPQLVLHLGAQALVGEGYRDPGATFATNVMGTSNLLQALDRYRECDAAVIVTSDKVYRDDGTPRSFVESDALGGEDPYSASKAAAEFVVQAWRATPRHHLPRLATARAGNVIGGGDFADGRLVPDIVRAQGEGAALQVRRPDATRPFQHVLDVLAGYLLLAQRLVRAPVGAPQALNFGPADAELSVRDLLGLWQAVAEQPLAWVAHESVLPERKHLALDSSLAARELGWEPRFSAMKAVASTSRWYARWRRGDAIADFSEIGVLDFLSASGRHA